MPDLLLELLSEEIPARMQARAAEDLKKLAVDGFAEAGLAHGAAAAFVTPRRLTLAVEGLAAQSPDLSEERLGPRTDAPEKAVEGFLRGTGLTRADLEEREGKKGRFFFATVRKPGRPAAEIVAELAPRMIRDFPWPKSMRWGAGALRWVRPLQSILCVLTDAAGAAEVVPFEVGGIASGDWTEGHRFMSPGRITATSFEDYRDKLRRAHVMLDPAERAETIRADAQTAAFAQGLEIVDDPGLLREVAGLVEWPVVLTGAIGDRFLDLPPEVLRTSMREHQKFFSMRDPRTGRIVKFATVANRGTADGGATILNGNGRVLAARLADAAFFWENDLAVARAGMGDWHEALERVTFHAKLGTQAERIARIAALARNLSSRTGAEPGAAEEAARVAKADLASEMVYEFPELQGVMAGYYAEAAGLAPGIAAACAEHYRPLGPSDDAPSEPLSVTVALADKIDTLAGFWAIDEKPTGSKDPFALRRAALGVIRLTMENGLRLPLRRFLEAQIARVRVGGAGGERIEQFLSAWTVADPSEPTGSGADKSSAGRGAGGMDAVGSLAEAARAAGIDLPPEAAGEDLSVVDDLVSFFHDRLKVFLRDRGIRHDVIDAALAMPNADDLALLAARAGAAQSFLGTDDGVNLVLGFKRANNILIQAEEADGVEYSYGPDPNLAEASEEKALFEAMDAAEPRISAAMEGEDFAVAMSLMAGLRAPIDAFFEAVQVNADNEILRRNRLNLLHRIRSLVMGVADLSKIEG